MAIKKIREVPTKLPEAKLYLDDIEEISFVFLEAFANVPVKDGESRHLTYEIDGTDICGSIADLEDHGGESTRFRISISDQDFTRLSLRKLLEPELTVYGLSEDEQWALFGKIEQIFSSRSSTLKNMLQKIPGWIEVSVLALVSFVVWRATRRSSGPVFLATQISEVATFFLYATKSRPAASVVFSRYRKNLGLGTQRKREYLKNFAFTCFGAILSVFLQALWDWLKAK